jgi:BirA family biotin operon repressor/biotin-[acetyl-CoA-carboxylase] ligase
MAVPLGLVQLHAAAEKLWQTMQTRYPALSIEVLPEVASTNTHVMQVGKAAFRANEPLVPTVAVAWNQTAGRGRHGRTWVAQPGQGLTLSLGYPLRLDWAQPSASALSLAVGVGVCEALQHALPTLPVQLKWPNDLWVAGRKLGGLLLEVAHRPHAAPGTDAWLVVGLGVNVVGTPVHLAHERCDLSMHVLSTPADVMQWVLPTLFDGLRSFERGGFAAFEDRYARFDALQGCDVQLWMPAPDGMPAGAGTPLAQGVAQGVNACGALLIQDAMGTTSAWPVGEVSVRPSRKSLSADSVIR